MSKKDFIALADTIKYHNRHADNDDQFTPNQLETLASFCRGQNCDFKKQRWLDYIAGECGPSGGAVKK